jgi:hypothetical protein
MVPTSLVASRTEVLYNDNLSSINFKCESVAQLQYQIDLEKKKTSDLQKELHVLQEDIGISRNNQSEPNSIRSNRDFSSYKAESSRPRLVSSVLQHQREFQQHLVR